MILSKQYFLKSTLLKLLLLFLANIDMSPRLDVNRPDDVHKLKLIIFIELSFSQVFWTPKSWHIS